MVRPGVSVAERTGVALATVIARKDRHADLAEACLRTYGIALPSTPGFVAQDGPVLRLERAGPVACRGGARTRADRAGHARPRLRPGDDFRGLASVTDQSDARGMLRLSGPRIRDTLAKGVNSISTTGASSPATPP